MTNREQISQTMEKHFQEVWSEGDYWDFKGSPFEQGKFDRQLAAIADRRYPRVLELGCGAGDFTRMLASYADHLLALDVAPVAIERAKGMGLKNVEFRAQDIMTLDLHENGPWDFIVMSETICCLGWLYPFFEIGYLACDLLSATRVGGRFLMANTFGPSSKDYLLRPWLVHTYRDLFLNTGFELESEAMYSGIKNEIEVHSLLTLYKKTKPSVPPYQVGPVERFGR